MTPTTSLSHNARTPYGLTPPTTLPDMPSVFVLSDAASVRQHLESLSRDSGWHTETFASAEEFLCQPVVAGPSCLVLDIGMLGPTRLDLSKLGDRAAMVVVLISSCGSVLMTLQAAPSGGAESATATYDRNVVTAAIRNAIEGSRTVLRQQEHSRRLRCRYDTLSHREIEVMRLVTSGLPNKLVGHRLGISEITVKAHRGRVMRKMEAPSLAELVRMSATLG